jgi:hypothetical protein
VDEKKLSELFKDAVRDTPPASFGTGEVRQASQRASERRRSGIIVGSALAIVILGGGAITAVTLSSGASNTSASVAAVGSGESNGKSGTMYDNGAVPGPSVLDAPQTPNDRAEPPMQGGTPTGDAGTAGSTLSGCDRADRELAAALASELPAAAKAVNPQPVPFACPTGSRGASFKVVDGPRSGTLSVVLVPKGVSPGIAPMGIGVPGTQNYPVPARQSGGTVYIISQPTPELAEPPFGEIGTALAAGIGQSF